MQHWRWKILYEMDDCVDVSGEKVRELKGAAVKPFKLEQRKQRKGWKKLRAAVSVG